MRTDAIHRAILLKLAKRSVTYGVRHSRALPIDLTQLPTALHAHRATFVTLYKNGRLRGCIGSLEGWRPLAVDVSENAYAAGFRDPRFPAIARAELPALTIKLSVLTVPQPMQFESESDLLRQIRPGIDGLILRYGSHRGTFLPSVWENLPQKEDFWMQLKHKANLPASWWSDDAQILRYQTEHIE